MNGIGNSQTNRETSAQDSPRNEMQRRLPRWVQPLLTELTGKAPDSGEPVFRWTPLGRVMLTVSVFFLSIIASFQAIEMGGLALLALPVSWLLTASSVRVIQTTVVHHASHLRLLPNPVANQWVAEILSLLAWISPLRVYAKYHKLHHQDLGGPQDPDLKFIIELGLKPGLQVAEYWKQFWVTMVSLRFHLMYIAARARDNFIEAQASRRLASYGYAIFLIIVASYTGKGVAMLLAYGFPVLILTQMAAWAGLLGLHQWVPIPGKSQTEMNASLTSGRYVGEPLPSSGLSGWRFWWSMAGWTLRMGTIHLFQRLAISPGDIPSHDWHHYHPVSFEWANHAFARRDAQSLDAKRSWTYAEIWGPGKAIGATFERFSRLPKNTKLGDPLTDAEIRSVLANM